MVSLRRITCFASLLLALSANASTVQLLTHEEEPNNFTKDGAIVGLYPEVAREIQSRLGQSLPITMLPWPRAFAKLQSEPATCILDMGRTPERENKFQWIGPITTGRFGFYAKRSNSLRIHNLAEAKAVDRVLVPNGWYTYELLKKLGFNNLEPTLTPETMVAMLLHDRGKLMFAAAFTLPKLLAKTQARLDDVEMVMLVNQSQSYIVCSQDTPPEFVNAWQHMLVTMKRDGTFRALFQKWRPDDTPPGITPEPYVSITN
ncbi:ABC transporter substrate-binding protein [Vogesella sp. LIG4]|uniref:substrate-binding periplasmic protein n=1 Tax=Vogesella sp. LIG4 TaxID=1192162 RepID=UPI00081FC0CE|nr:ABC transporter substrate-binding protein [Vogesella sp. LIG4]SCK14556.1 amino acid ABC transporter substrate-binding protein, PAAT family [Vogesella sp. LIG4]